MVVLLVVLLVVVVVGAVEEDEEDSAFGTKVVLSPSSSSLVGEKFLPNVLDGVLVESTTSKCLSSSGVSI